MSPLSAQADSSSAALEFFETRIRPVLVFECYDCHGGDKQSGGLRLDYRDALLAGGDSAPSIVLGDPENSLLIQAITHLKPGLEMPRKRPKLSEAVIADFAKWIHEGALDPRDEPPLATEENGSDWAAVFQNRKDWWSFKPVARSAIPADAAQTHPVDYWIQEKLTEIDLDSARPADRRTLIRRATYALTGLPPTVEETDTFLADSNPDAFAKLVERLLASPRFAERWARHWMDLVRFAETHGSEGDPDIPFAWRYRDYLIRAFNNDIPLDQLIREQIAGDLLPNPRVNDDEDFNESILGTAQFRLVEHGFQPVDTLDEQVRTLENQIDVVSKAFQGLTIACARCHDHKFDPISHEDYHGLYSIFASVRPSLVTIDQPEHLQIHREELEELKQDIKKGIASAWIKAGERLEKGIKALDRDEWTLPGDDMRSLIEEQEAHLLSIEESARQQAWKNRFGTNKRSEAIEPYAAWSFETGTVDTFQNLGGDLVGGAEIRDGRLVLNGKDAFFRSAPLPETIREKTLEAWVSLTTLDQRGGSVMTLETGEGAQFNGIVFGEQEPGHWVSGSDFFRRTRSAEGPRETQTGVIHLAFVYHQNGEIALYRNGERYGKPYRPDGEGAEVATFPANESRILLGLRHTGGGNAFLAGEIDEARLYQKALSEEDVRASFLNGPGWLGAEEIRAAMNESQRLKQDQLGANIAEGRKSFANRFPDYQQQNAERKKLQNVIETASEDPEHPLHPWTLSSDEAWDTWNKARETKHDERERFNEEHFHLAWDLGTTDAESWFTHGINPPETQPKAGAFAIEPNGEVILKRLLPSGSYSHLLSSKHNGVLTSPRFTIESDFISVRAFGGNGARVRVITDNYPLGRGNIFPQATLNSDEPSWIRLDTAYRKGATAYLEFAPATEVTSLDRQNDDGDRSFFGVDRIVFHDKSETPTNVALAPAERSLTATLTAAVQAWEADRLTNEQAAWLNDLIDAGLLPNSTDALAETASLIDRYRSLETEIPVPRRAPGVLETVGFDSPLLNRGDHRQPQETVERRYLDLIGSRPYQTDLSGRLELADEIASARNPLTARVMVNRVWYRLFGQGLVATVDNFGRLGDKPTHPELLDELAARFVASEEDGGFDWSLKSLIRFLMTSQAYQRASEPSTLARQTDPTNQWLSHMNVRRLDAESLRDSLLFLGNRLDLRPFGPGDNALAPPSEQRRRSVYVKIRRNDLSPFLQAFDAPKPFTTLGQRDATNVPAQSLALLNDPFVSEMAQSWAESIVSKELPPEEAIHLMFEQALGREASEAEVAASDRYLKDLQSFHEDPLLPWQDLALSLFNLKEFLYLR